MLKTDMINIVKTIEPNCIVIGAAKCGTTFLYGLLSQHPQIITSVNKELTLFTNKNNLLNSKKYLATQYIGYNGEKIVLDNTPEYMAKSWCATKIREFSGKNTKLICMIRNPAEAAFSGYMLNRSRGIEKESFINAVKKEINGTDDGHLTYRPFKRVKRDYVKRGIYIDPLKEFMHIFPRENLFIIVFEEFIKYTPSIMKNLLHFLEVDEDIIFNYNINRNPSLPIKPTIFTRPAHGILKLINKFGYMCDFATLIKVRKFSSRKTSEAKKILDEDSRSYLTEYFMDSILELENSFDLDLSHWKQ